MNIEWIYSNIDTTVFAISSFLLATYWVLHFSLFQTTVEELERLREKVLSYIANQCNPNTIVHCIDQIHKECKVLLFPPRKRNLQLIVNIWIFIFISVIVVTHKPLSLFFPYIPSKAMVLYVYTFSLAVTVLYLYYEASYFNKVRWIEKKYKQIDNRDK